MTEEKIENIVTGYIRENLSPTQHERQHISQLYVELQDFFRGQIFQSGSYARFTSTTPVSDLDVIYKLPDEVIQTLRMAEAQIDPSKLDLHNIIETLTKELRGFYGRKATVKPQPHSVGVYFGDEDDFSIDVVPAIPAPDGLFLVPETAHLSVRKRRARYISESALGNAWLKSDPIGYIEQAKSVDLKTDGRFRKTAKAVKKWKQSCEAADPDFPLKSFHLEIIVTSAFLSSPKSLCFRTLSDFFVKLPSYLVRPQFPDRADPSRYIDEYVTRLTDSQRTDIESLCTDALEFIKAIQGANDASQVTMSFESLLAGEAPTAAAASQVVTANTFSLDGTSHCQPPMWPENRTHRVHIDGYLYSPDGRKRFRGISSDARFGSGLAIRYVASTNVPPPYDAWWQVVNTGPHATVRNGLRGDFFRAQNLGARTSANPLVNWEKSEYTGKHWIECFIVKNGVMVARSGRFYVNIKNPQF